MNVSDAVASRRSVRAFLDKPVDREVLLRVLEKARRAPSGGNLQPWHGVLVAGELLAALIKAVGEQLRARGHAGLRHLSFQPARPLQCAAHRLRGRDVCDDRHPPR